jgi:hypothetical protein
VRKVFFLILIILLYGTPEAQKYSQVTIHAGENVDAYYKYRFPAFEDALVYLKNGTVSSYKMNFNLLLCEMQFIGPKGDTMEIANMADIDSVIFRKAKFIFDDGFYEIIASSGSIQLALSRSVSIEGIKVGAMGIESQGTSVDSYESFVSVEGLKGLALNQDVAVKEKESYFLISGPGEIVDANKSGFMKVFVGKSGDIEDFIKSERIHFNRQKDIETLFGYCTHPNP